ncbi:MAG: TonB-dependent receptor plug domain-containing protein, partial [Bacteroidota bacterium]
MKKNEIASKRFGGTPMSKIFFLLAALAVTAAAQPRLTADSSSRSDNGGRERADTARTYQLPEVLVTATRFERNPIDVGRSVTVIPYEQIKSSIFQSVGEVLAQHGGIYIVGIGQNPGMIQSIFMRGASNNQTAILVDDVRLTDPSSVNSALDLSELSFAALDRVEIVRGSHSTLYGSSAIGGVVNIITQKSRLPGIHADAEVRGGAFGKGTSTFSQNLFLNYTLPVGFYVNGEINNSDVRGLNATVDTVTNPNAFKNRDRDGFDKRDLWGKVGFRNDKVDLYLSFKNTRQRTDLDRTAYIDDDNYTLDFRRNLLTYGVSYSMSDALNLKAIGGYSEMRRLAVDDSSVVDPLGTTDHTYSQGEWEGTTLTNEIQSNFSLSGVQGVIGAGWYEERMSSRSYFYSRSMFGEFEFQSDLDSLHLNTTTANAFAHVDLNGNLVHESLNKFALALGARLNKHSTFGTYATYEINPSLKIDEGSLVYASYSTGF